MSVGQWKPFNPILGETYQVRLLSSLPGFPLLSNPLSLCLTSNPLYLCLTLRPLRSRPSLKFRAGGAIHWIDPKLDCFAVIVR